MTIKDATVQRFKQLCRQLGISTTELARAAGLTPSTVYSMYDPSRHDVSLTTVKKLVDGLTLYDSTLTIATFFDDELFAALPQEIQ